MGKLSQDIHGKTKQHEYYTEVEAKQGDINSSGWLSPRSPINLTNEERIVMGLNIPELQRLNN